MNRQDRSAWIALASVADVGDVTFGRLIAAYGGPQEALVRVAALPHSLADRLLGRRLGAREVAGLADGIRAAAADPERTERQMLALGGWVLTPFDKGYPTRLHDLDPPPAVLYGRGDRDALDAPRSIAVVGTRRPSPVARDLTARVCTRLVEAGVTVVSGLAVGIDGVAHSSTVEAGGRTVAVLGTGLARPGPRAHAHLAERIVGTGGALVSELCPEAIPTRGTFPRRNRIISALATATIVTEAPLRSGALITAHHALSQGRELFVAPGRPFDPRIAGCLSLLRETPARPLVGLDELIADLDLEGLPAWQPVSPATAPGAGAALGAVAALALLESGERAVAEQLVAAPRSTDALIAATALPASAVTAALTLLQLRGWSRPMGAIHLPAGPLLRTRSTGP